MCSIGQNFAYMAYMLFGGHISSVSMLLLEDTHFYVAILAVISTEFSLKYPWKRTPLNLFWIIYVTTEVDKLFFIYFAIITCFSYGPLLSPTPCIDMTPSVH